MGTFTELLSSSSSFSRLLDDIHQSADQELKEFIARSRRQTMLGSFSSEQDEEDALSLALNTEKVQKGSVKWHVYIEYLRAGVGLFLGFFLVTIVFSAHQGLSIFSNWWLASWSDEETYRYTDFSCSIQEVLNNTIISMSDSEWHRHRNRRFYIYCSMISVMS